MSERLNSIGIPVEGTVMDRKLSPMQAKEIRETAGTTPKKGCSDMPSVYTSDRGNDTMDVVRFSLGPLSKPSKEEDMREMWSLYHVIAVNKDNVDNPDYDPLEIDRKVVAKNEEHAKGLANYYRLLETKEYDNTKISVKVTKVMDIKPVEEDEEE